jgi:hypothetical protein
LETKASSNMSHISLHTGYRSFAANESIFSYNEVG